MAVIAVVLIAVAAAGFASDPRRRRLLGIHAIHYTSAVAGAGRVDAPALLLDAGNTHLQRRVGQPRRPFLFRLPVHFSGQCPMVVVAIAGQRTPFLCVADTGSRFLNVSADTCGACDTSSGVYVGTARQFDAAPTERIEYGTQHDTVKKVTGSVQLHAGGPLLGTDIHVTVERVLAVSNYNVLGLFRGQNSFLSAAMPPDAALYIRFYGPGGDFGRGFVAGIEPYILPSLRSHAIVDTPFVSTSVGCYIVALTGVRLDGRPVEASVPKFLLLDTGSNMTSFPAPLFRELLPGLLGKRTLTLEIDFQPVHIAASLYHSDDAANAGLMVDDDLSVLGDSPLYAILGAHAMQGMNLVFTAQNDLLVTSAVPTSGDPAIADDGALAETD